MAEPAAPIPENADAANERPPRSTTPPPLERILEALFFVETAPLDAARAAQAVRGLTDEQFQEAIHALNQAYRQQNRPYQVYREESGYRLLLRPAFRWVASKLYGLTRLAHLSVPALEVLSVVAYRQPVAKSEIEAIRGRDCGALLRQLVQRGLIALLPRTQEAKRDARYATTARFLELFGLRDLSELPETDDLQRI
jgi:segregation and condensation protein B